MSVRIAATLADAAHGVCRDGDAAWAAQRSFAGDWQDLVRVPVNEAPGTYLRLSILESKNRKKLVLTSDFAWPAACAARSASTDVMPLVPSALGQTFGSVTRTETIFHHSAS